MSELRKDPVIDRWVIITESETRLPLIKTDQKTPSNLVCPFCPGNEHMCPPEIYANREDPLSAKESGWSLRVIPNRSPVLMVEEDLKRMGEGLYDKISGIGANEVIIETPKHGIRQSEMEPHDMENVFWAYRDRLVDLKQDNRLRYALVYKNFGLSAGATIDHQYSLLMGLPIIPSGINEEIEGAKKHHSYKERCIFCDVLRQELQQGIRIVSESRCFLAFEPFAPRVPFETWILPKRHVSKYEDVEPGEIRELAMIFVDVMKRIDIALDKPSYNYVIHTSPFKEECGPYYHWHMEILPRIVPLTGFEWGSDLYINSTAPERAAAYLKEMTI